MTLGNIVIFCAERIRHTSVKTAVIEISGKSRKKSKKLSVDTYEYKLKNHS